MGQCNMELRSKSCRISVDKTPEVGAIFQTAAGPYGHVGVVESVNPNGTITVSEMNYAGFNVKSSEKFQIQENIITSTK